MKKTLLILLLIMVACTTAPEEPEQRWQEPRTISLADNQGAFEITFYPNNNTQNLLIVDEISDNIRNLNVIVKPNLSESQLQAIESFAIRNDLIIQR
ncbi:MAG: hypothetical protein ACMXX9_01630 [Candidatus Woesearchaeota archaeon]